MVLFIVNRGNNIKNYVLTLKYSVLRNCLLNSTYPPNGLSALWPDVGKNWGGEG